MAERAVAGYQGPIPEQGAFFDRTDVPDDSHTRTYWVDGERRIDIVAGRDPDRPARWQVAIRWVRREVWASHSWSDVPSEADALALIDMAGIGVEAAIGGAMHIGAYLEAAGGKVPR